MRSWFVLAAMAACVGCGEDKCPPVAKETEPGVCHVPGGESGSSADAGERSIGRESGIEITGSSGTGEGGRSSEPVASDGGSGGAGRGGSGGAGNGGSKAGGNGGSAGAGSGGVGSTAGSGGTAGDVGPVSGSEAVAVCGDGAVSDGETCEPNSRDHACPVRESCVSNGCVHAEFTGDGVTCNAKCTLTAITVAMPGDGCCPSGATSSIDRDCSCTADASCSSDAYCFGGGCRPLSCSDDTGCSDDRWCNSQGKCEPRRTGLCTRDRACPVGQTCKTVSAGGVTYQECG